MKISKDLEWLALNVDRWPSPEVTHIALDPDGEVRFKGAGSVKFDFTPGEPAKELVSNYAWFKGNPGHARAAWIRARRQLRTKEQPMDIERLRKDPAYWDEVAPEGATHYAPTGIDSYWFRDTERGWEAWSERTESERWVPASLSNPFLSSLIPRPSQPQWRGPEDGLPPVGTVCEARRHGGWVECEIIAHGRSSENRVEAIFQAPADWDWLSSPSNFRPLKPDKGRGTLRPPVAGGYSWLVSPRPPESNTEHTMHDDEPTRCESVRALARQYHGSDDCEVDQDAEVLFTDEGAWVQAWVWVPQEVDDD